MATGPKVQHYVECPQCDSYGKYFCNKCTLKLCADCKKQHESEHHDIVIYREKTIEFCTIHSALPYIMCCQQCVVPVCQTCIRDNHQKHSFDEIEVIFERKKTEYQHHISFISGKLLPINRGLLGKIHNERTKCKEEIDKIQSIMMSKAKMLKDIIDVVLAENTEFLNSLEKSLISELEEQEKIMIDHINFLEDIVEEYDAYISNKQHASFILFQHNHPAANFEKVPKIREIVIPSLYNVEIQKADIESLFGNIDEVSKSSETRLRSVDFDNDVPEELIPSISKITDFTVPILNRTVHITPLTSDQAWISDDDGNLVLTDMKGTKLSKIEYRKGCYGSHTVSESGDFIVLNKKDDAIYKFTSTKKSSRIVKVPQKSVCSVYSSPSNGDILVGMVHDGARVVRYKNTGEEIHQIQFDNTGQLMYEWPFFITENRVNGDVCVSDLHKGAVVVVDRDRKHRFSYTGYPPGAKLLSFGVCTDTRGRILVCDKMSYSVHMIDKDGHFLSFFLTTEQRIEDPTGLGLDVKNNTLWVGQWGNTVVSVYKYIEKQ